MRLVALLVLAVLLLGCSDAGTGLVEAPSAELPGCREDGEVLHLEPLHLKLDFFSVNRIGRSARILMQDGGRDTTESDGFFLEIPDRAAVRAALAGADSVEIPVGLEQGMARAAAFFNRTCRNSGGVAAAGTLQLLAFEIEEGGQVTGTLQGRLVDLRSGAALAEPLRVDFDFTVREGSSYQDFAPF